MTLQIYIPFNVDSLDPDAAKAYGERWLAINNIEGNITGTGRTIIAEVDRQQIRTLCEYYIQHWTTEVLRSYCEFRHKKMIGFLWLRLPESRETSLLLECVDEWEDDIMDYLKANGQISEYE